MIYCVWFADVLEHLTRLGFAEVGRGERFIAFEPIAPADSDGRPNFVTLVIRLPNVHGHLPEMIVNEAFDAAGLRPPSWDVFFGD